MESRRERCAFRVEAVAVAAASVASAPFAVSARVARGSMRSSVPEEATTSALCCAYASDHVAGWQGTLTLTLGTPWLAGRSLH